jgi:CRISPR/Cas system CSM-associated protein Csm3 (group 7 of RAMP superfamily)
MDIQYQLTFFSQWRSDAGASFGASADNSVVRDADGLPFFPGKTLKGLLREAVEDYNELTGGKYSGDIATIFGGAGIEGKCHFSDAKFEDNEAKSIVSGHLQRYLFHSKTTTALNDKGLKESHSLRTLEAVVPCTLCGTIYNVPEELKDLLTQCFKFIKYIGMHRNRGFGRCQLVEKGGNENV